MKYRLDCVLFGHKFVMTAQNYDFEKEIMNYNLEPLNFCLKCGLTKAECGITT